MEQDLSGRFIPVRKTKSDQLDANSKSHTATQEELELIRKHIIHNAKTVANRLHEGNIDNLPMQRGDRLACQYCEYAPVCGREPDSRKLRDCPDMSREEIFAAFAEENE